jgi:hypothetical protein
LPAPNNSFILNTMGDEKIISGLTANHNVTGKVTCSGTSVHVSIEGEGTEFVRVNIVTYDDSL